MRTVELKKRMPSVLSLRLLALICACILLFVFPADAQKQKEPDKMQDLDLSLPEKSATTAVQPGGIAYESTVNPEKYFVGPSDVIAVNIWMSPPMSFALTVTPEGTLIIPSVGEVAVADLTLASAKAKIFNATRKKYLTADITATLVKPRPIIVKVIGAVLNEGLYTLNATDRTHRAIEEANKLTKLQTPEEVAPILKQMSSRNITVKHRDGTQDRVDLPKYFATKDEKLNPYLREGDIVIIPAKDLKKTVFAVYGQVNSPGRYEFVEGDSVLDAIKIANGLTSFAIPENAMFSRSNENGTSITSRIISLTAIKEGREPNFSLEPGDRIMINKKPELREDYNVDIKGEVLYPGTYPITRNSSRLSQVVKLAGGFTDYASLSSAEVVRRSYDDEGIKSEKMMSLRGGVATEDSSGYLEETDLRIHRAGVTVDFEKLFVQKDSSQDIILQGEDQIIIPSRQHTVYVFGQVASPGHLPYVQGKDAGYYVDKAGGFTNRANKGGLTIVKAKTKQWISPGDTKLEEGDYIWVPTEADRPFGYYMTIASQAAGVLSVIIGVGVLIVQVTK